MKKKLQELIKRKKKSQKPCPIDYNLLIAQDLCYTNYQNLLIILMKKFIKLIANADIITKNKKTDGINTKIASAVLNRQALKMI